MSSNQHSNTSRAVISMIVILAIVLIAVLLSAAMQAGGWMFIGLIVGLVALAALTAWLVSFIVKQYVTWSEARNKSREANNTFTLNCLKVGYLPDGRGGFKPIQQLHAPVAPRAPVFNFDPSDIHTASVNYLLYSINLLGENGNRLASAPECAAATNLMNYSARSRDRIVKHLSNAYGVVTQPGPIENGGGTFVPEAYGTIGRLYHHVRLNSQVAALPENKR